MVWSVACCTGLFSPACCWFSAPSYTRRSFAVPRRSLSLWAQPRECTTACKLLWSGAMKLSSWNRFLIHVRGLVTRISQHHASAKHRVTRHSRATAAGIGCETDPATVQMAGGTPKFVPLRPPTSVDSDKTSASMCLLWRVLVACCCAAHGITVVPGVVGR
mgnify:CR=1 FL=1